MDEVKQHLAETRVAVSAVLSLSHALVQQIDALLPTLRDKSAAHAQALGEIASLMRREGSLAHLLARVEGALEYALEQMERRTEGSTWLNREPRKE
jgi:hypothetical protein